MRFTDFWTKTWYFVRLGIMRRVRQYGIKLFYTGWIILTLVFAYLVDRRPENDYAIVLRACPNSEIVAEAEHIYWGNVSRLIFICKEQNAKQN